MNNKKTLVVLEIKKHSNESALAGIIEYKGTKSIDMKYLRKECYDNNIIIKVVKNTLANIAIKNTINEKLSNDLNDQILLIFSKTDISTPIKIINSYIKNNKANLKIKKLCLYGKLVEKENIDFIMNLPNKDIAIKNLMLSIQKPIKNLLNLLKIPHLNLINLMKLKK